jgi:exodeoxyribonuclease VIII
MKTGIYHNIPFEEYIQIDAVNFSTMKHISKSPLHYKHASEVPQLPTSAMRIGKAVHCAILEPDKFESDYTFWAESRRGKDWNLFKAENSHKEILTIGELTTVTSMSESVRNHRCSNNLLLGGECEVTVVWTDASTGLKCKARIDYIDTEKEILIDLKTTKDASSQKFTRDFFNYQYHAQLAHYRKGVQSVLGGDFCAMVIAVENTAPFDVVPYKISHDALSKGISTTKEWMTKIKGCTRSDRWRGISDDVLEINTPSWMADEEQTELIIGGKEMVL